ncbi:hypothetical protein BDD12DRAFT_910703 [Trichophaea hybrida]|nr:hypothetical protein BDD12DRAFT_910703 [Trichophaea hybrida]
MYSEAPSPPIDQSFPKVYVLVTGAPHSETDSMILDDFCGICRALKEENFGATFMTTVDIYDVVKRFKNPIKCQRGGVSRTVVSVQEPDKNLRWYLAVFSALRFKELILKWIAQTAASAKPGAAVDIILVRHGRMLDSAYSCGSGVAIQPLELARACRAFVYGVQANVISGTCFSGSFADIFRSEGQTHRFIHTATRADEIAWGVRTVSGHLKNTKFGGAYVHQLPKLHFLGKHTRHIKEAVYDDLVGTGSESLPQTYQADLKISDLVEDLLFKEYVSITYDPNTKVPQPRFRLFTSETTFMPTTKQDIPLDLATSCGRGILGDGHNGPGPR